LQFLLELEFCLWECLLFPFFLHLLLLRSHSFLPRTVFSVKTDMKVVEMIISNQMFRKFFRFRFRFIVPEPMLGRWTRTSEKMNSIKIFWANVYHCGTCSGERMKKKEVSKLSSPREVKETR